MGKTMIGHRSVVMSCLLFSNHPFNSLSYILYLLILSLIDHTFTSSLVSRGDPACLRNLEDLRQVEKRLIPVHRLMHIL